MPNSVFPVNMAAKMPVPMTVADNPEKGSVQKTVVQQSESIKQIQPTTDFQLAGRFIFCSNIFSLY